jgi:hypothetical protein
MAKAAAEVVEVMVDWWSWRWCVFVVVVVVCVCLGWGGGSLFYCFTLPNMDFCEDSFVPEAVGIRYDGVMSHRTDSSRPAVGYRVNDCNNDDHR